MRYQNPVLRGFYPDPSICRVGEDFYLVTSTFEYFPGIPVFHSRDLVNWEQIGNCIDRIGQLPLEKAEPSGGIWAPAIRYDNGIYYVTATFGQDGNFLITARNPAGPWSDPVWVEMDGIDPSLYFEEGKLYYCANDCGSRQQLTGREGISLGQLDPRTGKVIGEIRQIWNGTGGGFLEAPHIYQVGDWYYLLAAEGGTGLNHMTTMARSRTLFGPYESCPCNPILTNRNDTSKQALCCGHADLIEDGQGHYFLVHLGTRPSNGFMGHLGRETFLTPVTWRDGWLQVQGGKAKIEEEAFLPGKDIFHKTEGWKEFCDDFTEKKWDGRWLFLQDPEVPAVEKTGDGLRIYPGRLQPEARTGFSFFAGVRQMDLECVAETALTWTSAMVGAEAGLVVYLAPGYQYRFCRRREADGTYLVLEKQADDFRMCVFHGRIPEGRLHIRVCARKQEYAFYAGTAEHLDSMGERQSVGLADGASYDYIGSASTRFLCCEVAGKCFTGTLIGLYAKGGDENDLAIYHYYRQLSGSR